MAINRDVSTTRNVFLLVNNSVQIRHGFERAVPELVAVVRAAEEGLNHLQARVDLDLVQQGLPQPSAETIQYTY